MGKLEHIDQLETYIKDLGNEIESVKKASEYLKLIEQFQAEMTETSSDLNKTKDHLKIYQEIMEGKLELFQTTTRNVEAKQQSLEKLQLNTLENQAELKQQQGKNEKVINQNHNVLMAELNRLLEEQKSYLEKLINQSHSTLMAEHNRTQDEQKSKLDGMSKTNKVFFAINATLSISIVGMLVYLIM